MAGHVAFSRLFDAHARGSLSTTRSLVDLLLEARPDVVHMHNIHGYYVNQSILFRALRENQISTVWTLHDAWAFTGHCAYFDFVGCDRWTHGCGRCPQTRSYPTSWLLDASHANFVRKEGLVSGWDDLVVVTPSRWLQELTSRSMLRDARLRVIPNDPDWTSFAPVESQWRQTSGARDRYVILGVANVWETRKGLVHLVDLASKLRDDEVVVIVGRLPSGYELPDGCIHVEHTKSAEELAAIYTAADLYVNPTMEDNYPTTNLEAMACGTPVITFDTGGAPETLERGVGVVASERSSEGIRSAIDDWRDQGRARDGVNSVLRPSNGDMVSRYLALYEELVDDEGRM